MLGEFTQVANLGLLLAAVAVAALWTRSNLVKQRHEELEQLANTRGERIEDLQARIMELEAWKERMEGKIEALELLKVDQIVVGVVAGVVPHLVERK